MELYSTASQLIIVLVLAMTVESNFNSSTRLARLEKQILALIQYHVFFVGILTLSLALLKLAKFDFWGMKGGETMTILSILFLFILLFSHILVKNSSKTSTRKLRLIVILFALLTLPSTVLGSLEIFDMEQIDYLFLIGYSFQPILFWIFFFKDKKRNFTETSLILRS